MDGIQAPRVLCSRDGVSCSIDGGHATANAAAASHARAQIKVRIVLQQDVLLMLSQVLLLLGWERRRAPARVDGPLRDGCEVAYIASSR